MQSSKQAIADSSTKLRKEEPTISLDNLSPGRPGLDELVPSRYTMKVGKIEVMVVSDKVLSLAGATLGHNVDPAVRGAWLGHNFLPPDVLERALNVVVVKSAGPYSSTGCGLSIGYEDTAVSYLRTGRAPLDETVVDDSALAPRAPEPEQINHLHLSQNDGIVGLTRYDGQV